jgi:hypothetical protein
MATLLLSGSSSAEKDHVRIQPNQTELELLANQKTLISTGNVIGNVKGGANEISVTTRPVKKN